jgi:hypothetical protein
MLTSDEIHSLTRYKYRYTLEAIAAKHGVVFSDDETARLIFWHWRYRSRPAYYNE